MQLTGDMIMRKCIRLLAGLLLAVAGVMSGAAQAANTVGQVTHLSGTLIDRGADGTTKLLSVKSEVQQGDTLSTEQDTYARIKFVDGGEVVLRPGTQLKVVTYSFNRAKPAEGNVFLSMLKGGMRAVTGLIGKVNHSAVKYDAVTATIGIRGTHFGALLCQNDCGGIQTISGTPPANGLHVDVASGAIVVSNAAGQQVISAGQFGFVQSFNSLPVIVPPSQGVTVTMPSSISQNNSNGRGIGKSGNGACAVQ
jgi:FecR protein